MSVGQKENKKAVQDIRSHRIFRYSRRFFCMLFSKGDFMKCLKYMNTVGKILFFLVFVFALAMNEHIGAVQLRLCFFFFFVSLLLIVPYDVANLMNNPKPKENNYDVLYLKKYLFFETALLFFFAIMLFVIE